MATFLAREQTGQSLADRLFAELQTCTSGWDPTWRAFVVVRPTVSYEVIVGSSLYEESYSPDALEFEWGRGSRFWIMDWHSSNGQDALEDMKKVFVQLVSHVATFEDEPDRRRRCHYAPLQTVAINHVRISLRVSRTSYCEEKEE